MRAHPDRIRSMRTRWFGAWLLAGLAGCGDEGAPFDPGDAPIAMDCGWVEESNCWRAVVAAAAGCLPIDGSGTFDAARRSCTYADGLQIRFAEPVPASAALDHPWRFSLERDGAACMSVERITQPNGSAELAVSTAAGTVRVLTRGAGATSLGSIDVECPDGTTYRGHLARLSACENGAAFAMPGVLLAQSAVMVDFSLANAGPPRDEEHLASHVRVFQCRADGQGAGAD